MEKEKLLGLMKGQLIVSCQALPGEAFYDETISLMDRFAIAAQRAGAAMIRANGLRDIQAVKKATGLPVIGLIKKEYPGYDAYITPTENEIEALLSVHADVIALDCTHRQRGDGRNTIEFMTASVVYYNQGKVVGIEDGIASDVKPGRTGNFNIDYPYNSEYEDIKFDDYKVFVTEAYSYN